MGGQLARPVFSEVRLEESAATGKGFNPAGLPRLRDKTAG
jgi:hypothetical protein